jgi:hypothetical protein
MCVIVQSFAIKCIRFLSSEAAADFVVLVRVVAVAAAAAASAWIGPANEVSVRVVVCVAPLLRGVRRAEDA